MSGIAAILDLTGTKLDTHPLADMLSVLKRRGPDGTGTKTLGPVAMGCARLDTLPQDGPQPATAGHVTAVADARLDNREELERMLGRPDGSDADLIAAAIARWGMGAAERLEGDYAILAWNGTRLLAVRDRFGVRPLYFAKAANQLLIASEIHALLAHHALPGNVDARYFIEYLAGMMPPTERSPYQGIRRLLPGHLLVAAPGKSLSITRYYTLPSTLRTGLSLDEAAEGTRRLLEEAVLARRRALGPVTCDLSGGLDSTSAYAILRQHDPATHARSFVSDTWPALDEREYSAPLVGNGPWLWLYFEHHLPGIDALAAACDFDEPPPDMIAGGIMRALYAARPEGGKVALSGNGGDAIMCGSTAALRHLLGQGRLLSAYREGRTWADTREIPLARALLQAARPVQAPPMRLPWASTRIRRMARRVARQAASGGGRPEHTVFHQAASAILRQQQTGPFETRYPYFDRALVEFALATPPTLKLSSGVDKLVLRRAMAPLLTQAILSRTHKTEFTPLYAHAMARNWAVFQDLLNEPVLSDMGVLDARAWREMVAGFKNGDAGRSVEVRTSLSAELWLRARLGLGPGQLDEQPVSASMLAAGQLKTKAGMTPEEGGR